MTEIELRPVHVIRLGRLRVVWRIGHYWKSSPAWDWQHENGWWAFSFLFGFAYVSAGLVVEGESP